MASPFKINKFGEKASTPLTVSSAKLDSIKNSLWVDAYMNEVYKIKGDKKRQEKYEQTELTRSSTLQDMGVPSAELLNIRVAGQNAAREDKRGK